MAFAFIAVHGGEDSFDAVSAVQPGRGVQISAMRLQGRSVRRVTSEYDGLLPVRHSDAVAQVPVLRGSEIFEREVSSLRGEGEGSSLV